MPLLTCVPLFVGFTAPLAQRRSGETITEPSLFDLPLTADKFPPEPIDLGLWGKRENEGKMEKRLMTLIERGYFLVACAGDRRICSYSFQRPGAFRLLSSASWGGCKTSFDIINLFRSPVIPWAETAVRYPCEHMLPAGFISGMSQVAQGYIGDLSLEGLISCVCLANS